jgi:16S rRNA (cytidine1402-2'-O)-methyltransferase
LFEGFLPATAARRRKRLAELAARTETIVVYEAVHRIQAAMADIVAELGAERRVVAARELTKLHECFYRGTAAEVQVQLASDPGAARGEYTLVIAGAAAEPVTVPELDRVLRVLLGYLGVRQSADAAARLLDVRKRDAYQRALELRESTDSDY